MSNINYLVELYSRDEDVIHKYLPGMMYNF